MKHVVVVSVVVASLLVSTLALSQVRTGNLYGRVVDQAGQPIGGAQVTLSGSLMASLISTTDTQGDFKFLSLPPSRDYKVEASIEGFRPAVTQGISIETGSNVEVVIRLERGLMAEVITVTAEAPVIDPRKTSLAHVVTSELLKGLPTARDPWVVVQAVPSVTIDRENVGGSESGQQSLFFAKGSGDYSQNTWALDGVVITDPSAIGGSPTYYDFDAFEEMSITVGSADPTVQTGGVNVNLVTKRGGNEIALEGRYYMTDEKFQAKNLDDSLKAEGVKATNRILGIRDYGINIGGPFIKDRLWGWGSYGSQDIKTINIVPRRDDTLLTNYTFKIDAQPFTGNRAELLLFLGNKEKFGRDSSQSFPAGRKQESLYHFGSPVLKVQDEHVFGDNLLVSGKIAFANAGFQLTAMDDLDFERMYTIDSAKGDVVIQSFPRYRADRPTYQFSGQAVYFPRRFLNANHEFKVGYEVKDAKGEHLSDSPGNLTLSQNLNWEWADTNGDGNPDLVPGSKRLTLQRQGHDAAEVRDYSLYFSDTANIGRWVLLLGARFDRQNVRIVPYEVSTVDSNPVWSSDFTPDTPGKLKALLPPLSIPAIDPGWSWNVFSPRLGVTYDIRGDGKTIAKLNFARYGNVLGTGWADLISPLGTGGFLRFYWMDNGDNLVDWRELYWVNMTAGDYRMYTVFDEQGNFGNWWSYGSAQGNFWAGFDPAHPTDVRRSTYTIAPSFRSPSTWETIVSIDRELASNLGASVSLTYRKYTDFEMDVWYYPDSGKTVSGSDYVVAGYVPDSIGGFSTGNAGGRPYYLLAPGVANTDYRYYGNRPDYYRDYVGLDIAINKRLAGKWMLYSSATFQTQSQHMGAKGALDAYDVTNRWALDGGLYAPDAGSGSGKTDQSVFSSWMLKGAAVYQLPKNINVAATFNARQGYPVRRSVTIMDSSWPNASSRSVEVMLEEFGKSRLPAFWDISFRVEKPIVIHDKGTLTFTLDAFNLFNNSIALRRFQYHLGTYDVATGTFSPYALNGKATEIHNPRVLRLGVRYTF